MRNKVIELELILLLLNTKLIIEFVEFYGFTN